MYRRKVKNKEKKEEIKQLKTDYEILKSQGELLKEYLESIKEGKKDFQIKYPNADKMRHELSFNEKFRENMFEKALECKVIQGEIFIQEEKNGVRRIYDRQGYLYQLASIFYNFLKFKWLNTAMLLLEDIWAEYSLYCEFSHDMFLEIIQLLEQELIISLSKNKEDIIVVKKNLNSGNSKEDILKE